MKRQRRVHIGTLLLMIGVVFVMTGCGSQREESSRQDENSRDREPAQTIAGNSSPANRESAEELEVRFGDDGEPFMLRLNGSDTAAAIARHVGTTDWRLPIYEDDEDADYDILQYYDIPEQYEIPSAPQKVTSVKAGEAYYSEPNRIVLYYQDAEVSEEYTPIGNFDATDAFVKAVKENPVLEGWGNKIVQITKPR